MNQASNSTVHDVIPLRSAELTMAPQASADAATVPTRILIAPWGNVASTSGEFVVDDESAALAIAAFDAHGADLPIDYEHQTLGGEFASPTGQAPAAGWIKRLSAEAPLGLFAEVEWTAPALEQLAARQYRYLSPVAIVRRADRKLIGLHSAALTNKPAIAGAAPIVNKAAARRVPVEPACTLADGPDPITFITALDDLRQRLGLAALCDAETVLIAASRKLAELDENAARQLAAQRVAEALRAGKLTESQRGWALRLALKDPSAFEQWLTSAPLLVALGRTRAPATLDVESARHHRAAAARSEYRAHPELSAITSEEAFINDALRQV